MKKIVLSILIALSVSGYSQSFTTGNSNISAGYGIGNFIQSVFKSYQTYDNYAFKSLGPMFLKYEHALNDRLGIGVNVAYANASVSYLDKSHVVDSTSLTFYKQTIKWSTYSILARLNFHFANSEKFDPYWGFGVGYRGASWKYEDNDPNYDNDTQVSNFFPLGLEVTIGARYYFTPSIGAYAEFGIAKAIVQFGIAANLY
jgi:opacity protein-like surface antigen